MKYRVRETVLALLIFFLFSVVNAQEDWECGLTEPPLVQLDVSVWSKARGYLKDLTYKDFEVYDENARQDIDTFAFDEIKNQYTVGFYPKVFSSTDNKWHEVKIEIKLSEERKKDYGKIFIRAQDGYYPNQK